MTKGKKEQKEQTEEQKTKEIPTTKPNDLEEKKDELRDFEMQRLRASQSYPKARKSNEILLKTIQTDRLKVEGSICVI